MTKKGEKAFNPGKKSTGEGKRGGKELNTHPEKLTDWQKGFLNIRVPRAYSFFPCYLVRERAKVDHQMKELIRLQLGFF